MNRALWIKAISAAWRQWVASAVLLFLFSWVFVWLMSRFPVGAIGMMLSLLPEFLQSMVGVPVAQLATPMGQISILFVHVITMLVTIGWALGRGSDAISGEIGRGTMDLIVSLPVWRVSVLGIPAVVTTVGAVLLVASVWLGMAVALLHVRFQGPVSLLALLPGAVNLFAMVFCLSGMTALVSSLVADRWRTIAITGGFFIVSLILKLIARMWSGGQWLSYLTFLTLFQPQELILLPDPGGLGAMRASGGLLALGLACYAAAAAVFSLRDIPAAR